VAVVRTLYTKAEQYVVYIRRNNTDHTITFRRLRDGNRCLKGQLEDLKHIGKMMLWKI